MVEFVKDITVRKAGITDITKLSKLHTKIWKADLQRAYSTKFLVGLTVPSFKEKWRVWLTKENVVTLVAEIEKKIIGLITFDKSLEKLQTENAVEILFLYIDLKYETQGIGYQLFKSALNLISHTGIKKAYSWVLKNMARSACRERVSQISGMTFFEVRYDFNL